MPIMRSRLGPRGSLGIRNLAVVVAGVTIAAVVTGRTTTDAPAEPFVAKGGSRVYASGEAITDTATARADSPGAATAGAGPIRSGEAAESQPPRPDRRVIASRDALPATWEGGAAGDAWINRPTCDDRQPPPTSADWRRYAWADAMWLFIVVDRYNRQVGMPLGPRYSRWVDTWRRPAAGPGERSTPGLRKND